MINHTGLFFLRSMIVLIIFNCYQSHEGTKIVTKFLKKLGGRFNNSARCNEMLQNRLLNVKVKSFGDEDCHGNIKWKRAFDSKRTEVLYKENENLTRNFWENLNFLWKNSERLKEMDQFKTENFLDNNQYQEIQNNYFTIPKKAVELLQLENMCPRRNTEIHPCRTIFTRTRLSNAIWPREVITASCQCNGQRCSIMGIDTCVTLVSKITVIRYTGSRAKEYVPVACACMALKGNSAKEIIPLIV